MSWRNPRRVSQRYPRRMARRNPQRNPRRISRRNPGRDPRRNPRRGSRRGSRRALQRALWRALWRASETSWRRTSEAFVLVHFPFALAEACARFPYTRRQRLYSDVVDPSRFVFRLLVHVFVHSFLCLFIYHFVRGVLPTR